MPDTSSQQWLWTASLPDTISGIINELRMPVVTMRGALDLIQQFTSCQAYQRHQPILRTHVDRVKTRIDQLFNLRALFTGIDSQPDIRQPVADAIVFVQVLISDLHHDIAALQQDIQVAHADCYQGLESRLQPIFTMVYTNSDTCLESIQFLLHDGLLQRLKQEQGNAH